MGDFRPEIAVDVLQCFPANLLVRSMRCFWVLVLPFVLTSCRIAMLGDPVASTDYVVTSGSECKVAEIVRKIGESNGLRSDGNA